MKMNRIARLIAVVALAARTAYPQTAAELMQKGIYTQETAGDLDGAIAIYRQIVNSGSSPRDIAAQAPYRLAQTLLQKGDLGNAATEFSNLARSYADYARLVSSMASHARESVAAGGGGRGGRGGQAEPQQLAADIAKVQAQLAAVAGDPAKMAEVDRTKVNLQAALAELQAVRARVEAESEGGGRVDTIDRGTFRPRTESCNPSSAVSGSVYEFHGARMGRPHHCSQLAAGNSVSRANSAGMNAGTAGGSAWRERPRHKHVIYPWVRRQLWSTYFLRSCHATDGLAAKMSQAPFVRSR
jgi:hypothetical protein